MADFNHYGIPDIVVATGITTANGGTTMAVVLGAGNGNFHPVVQYATNQAAQFVSVADVNGDGNPDILVASFVNGRATLIVSSIRAGTHILTAVYSGNRYHVPRRSNTVTEIFSREYGMVQRNYRWHDPFNPYRGHAGCLRRRKTFRTAGQHRCMRGLFGTTCHTDDS